MGILCKPMMTVSVYMAFGIQNVGKMQCKPLHYVSFLQSKDRKRLLQRPTEARGKL